MKKTAAPSPEDDGIGAKLDRIIELLEQQRGTYPQSVPIPLWRPYPYYPYWPNWVTSTAPNTSAAVGGTIINNAA